MCPGWPASRHAVAVSNTSSITIPADLLPADGRFCSGPSKVRPEQVAAVVAGERTLLGTSHRKPAVKGLVGDVQEKLATLFGLPAGWEVVLGNGGTTVFWDAATFGLVEHRSQHLSFGEFSSKFATACAATPHLGEPSVISAEPGTHPTAVAEQGVDTYALTHNETSTGVAMELRRPDGIDEGAIVAVDATSAAGGLRWDPREVDAYYFAPQKCFASDGGLWFAACSPAAVERIERIGASDRWRPASIDLQIALDNSRQHQTYNTPAVATLIMLDAQLDWMLDGGGLDFAAGRSEQSAAILYGWAERTEWAAPFVADTRQRSAVVGTIDLDDAIDATAVSAALRANGVLDTDAYRKLGRNQLRIGMFPAIDPSDVEALTGCVEYVVDHMRSES
ncbi:MAG: phosphoserine transaminase [Ilumatobacteraceae bacterium]|nr:phosphoserine transaminase [Ilumatobacteraceae bacterium]